MARHAASAASSSVLRTAGLTLTMAGAALTLATGGAQAGELDVPAALAGAVNPITNLQVNPLANTGVDPLNNGIGTKVADFPAVGTSMVTDSVTKGAKVGELPTAAASSLLGPLLPGAVK
ncbi:hypothetical protein [Streptomyces sp. G-G2]|uniref:hypothetical protein n=1 Tax=Streptomyces sp. G-G2 TaxID=3046201 RepID=UPI0024B9CDD5|nr:hypothetical protein [Streptomyces sp. G-G2]MDJ0385706.1 hypothetical protein [Streptomyces sp. G-G2]